jgi:UDP-N-acetylglucosamine:LPS N-acetylglucosamine transferase
MKILILDNSFYRNQLFTSNKIDKYLNYYKRNKLKKLCKKLKAENEKDLKIKIITNRDNKFFINNDIDVQLLSDYRLEIEPLEFLKIKDKFLKNTKNNLIRLFHNLLDLKTFHNNGVFLGKVLEFRIGGFLKPIFGEFELYLRIIQKELYDKIIFFNYNPYSLDFIKFFNRINKNIEIYTDFMYKKLMRALKLYYILKTNLFSIGAGIKNHWFRKSKLIDKSNKKSILFLANSKNQIESVKNIYNKIKSDKELNLIQYKMREFITFKNIHNLLRDLLQIRRICITNQQSIFKNISYDSINLKEIFKEFYEFEFLLFIIKIFNSIYHFEQLIKFKLPSLVIITNDLNKEGRLHAKLCKLKGIPTMYIQHAANPVMEDIVTKTDITYITLAGENEKEIFIKNGVKPENIFVTGRPVYDSFHNQKIGQLKEVRDMFDNQKFLFDPKKFVILFTTNAIDEKSTEKACFTVINSLKKLNLVENLIIKTHPSEGGEVHRAVKEKLQANCTIVKDYNILELIKSSQLLLSEISTTILEAMIIGTPVIHFDLINTSLFLTGKYLFIDEEELITVNTQEDLTSKIKELVENPELYSNYKVTLNKVAEGHCFYDKNEPATKKIIKIIYNIIGNKQK